MSDTEETNGSDQEEVTEFKCRKCPGKTFTAAEKDSHRQFHRKEKEKANKKPGPKSKTRASRARSPDASEVTLFEPVEKEKEKETRKQKGKRTRSRKDEEPAPPAKRKSNKRYNDNIVGNWSNGTGA